MTSDTMLTAANLTAPRTSSISFIDVIHGTPNNGFKYRYLNNFK